ncbi:MAG TPA: hypothetical protein PLL89_02300 [bacterium]|nr:hypothetical protein [bacterium]
MIIPIQAVRIAFEKLGLSPAAAFFVLLASLIGSFINIPLAVKTNAGFVSAFSYFSGFLYEAPEQAQVIALNLEARLSQYVYAFIFSVKLLHSLQFLLQ